jgi:glucokinase
VIKTFGQHHHSIALANVMNVIGIDIGGTKCAISRLTDTGHVEETDRFPTRDLRSTLDAILEGAGRLVRSPEPVFGISCGGPLDSEHGIIVAPPNLPDWRNVEITRILTDRLGGRAFLMNDANASALAEWRFGAGRGCRHLIYLTAGTGMGAGLIINGQLYEGASGDAGEVGHIRLAPVGPLGYGKAGSVEGFCSGGGIARLAEVIVTASPAPHPLWFKPGVVSAREVAEAAGGGDPIALEIMRQAGHRLGEALAVLIDILNPERIVIGGIFARCGELLASPMRDVLAREALPGALAACRIVPSAIGETIGSHAAIAAALYRTANGSWPHEPVTVAAINGQRSIPIG